LIGREVDRYGDRVPGTIIGGAAGALIGRELDRGGRRC
ncbi:MAG: glycine zipper 2TM domain-containing protein, partial [Sphingopyxis sp.]|nr:glycine zipper 2TM domain-containing protein [Sphingopyxis sp.]